MKKRKLFVFIVALFTCSIVLNAQNYPMPKFYEVTESFFKTDKSYDLSLFMNVFLGSDGITNYQKGDAKVMVKEKVVTIKYEDGSGSPKKIVGEIQDCIVYTSNGDVKMQMYVLEDASAIRAIKYEDGEIQLHSYIYNKNMKKYIHAFVYNLYKD